jgi:hypothetical protein
MDINYLSGNVLKTSRVLANILLTGTIKAKKSSHAQKTMKMTRKLS